MEVPGIRVLARIRPSDSVQNQCLLVDLANNSLRCFSADAKFAEEFIFDKVFDQCGSQEDVFEGVKSVVISVLDGWNGTIMAYGQTAAGKTHTLFGDSQRAGIVPRAVSLLTAPSTSSCSTKVALSLLEVYNERIRDLLDASKDNLNVFHEATSIRVAGLCQRVVADNEDCMRQIQTGLNNRAVGATAMNETSSRSHCFVILTLKRSWSDGRTQTSKLCLVDLAGSERSCRTHAQGVTLQEGQNINKSLLVLGTVVNALTDGKHGTRVPYRDSKLTRLLQDCIGGTATTAILVCCSPHAEDQPETLSTLRFGARARGMKSKPVANPVTAAANIAIVQVKDTMTDEFSRCTGRGRPAAIVRKGFAWSLCGVALASQIIAILLLTTVDSLCEGF